MGINGEVYKADKDTIVKNAKGDIIGSGDFSEINKGDTVDVNGNVYKVTKTKDENANKALKDAKAKLEKAIEDAKTKDEADYDVNVETAKDNLEAAVKTAEEAVKEANKAEEEKAEAEAKKNILRFTQKSAKYEDKTVGKTVTIEFEDLSKVFEVATEGELHGANQEDKFKVTAYFNNGKSYTNSFIKGIKNPFKGNTIDTTFYNDMEGKDFYSWNLESTKGFNPSDAEVVRVVVEFEHDGEILKVELDKE